jgi:ectoine hydroxylase-related dioxygenase (phytanoyl-CoA dioxygenase family)
VQYDSVFEAPIDELSTALKNELYSDSKVDFDALSQLGFFVLRKAFKKETVTSYLEKYLSGLELGSLFKSKYHLTEVKIPKENVLREILAEPEFLYFVKNFFDGNVGADFLRVVKKDKDSNKSVFLHQDSGYQVGSLERFSLFITLTDCGPKNGGLVLYPGTHHFGYLGDVGAIRNDLLPKDYPKIQPRLSAGDVLIMHSSIWHESTENLSEDQRVYLEVHIQSINEPNTDIEICGTRSSSYKVNLGGASNSFEDQIFLDSRTQRLRTLYEKINNTTPAGEIIKP